MWIIKKKILAKEIMFSYNYYSPTYSDYTYGTLCTVFTQIQICQTQK